MCLQYHKEKLAKETHHAAVNRKVFNRLRDSAGVRQTTGSPGEDVEEIAFLRNLGYVLSEGSGQLLSGGSAGGLLKARILKKMMKEALRKRRSPPSKHNTRSELKWHPQPCKRTWIVAAAHPRQILRMTPLCRSSFKFVDSPREGSFMKSCSKEVIGNFGIHRINLLVILCRCTLDTASEWSACTTLRSVEVALDLILKCTLDENTRHLDVWLNSNWIETETMRQTWRQTVSKALVGFHLCFLSSSF